MMTISTPVMATSIIERLKKVKKRLLSSATGSSECPLMLIRNCKNGKTLHCVLHEVHDREDDNPNDVYEVPVKSAAFNIDGMNGGHFSSEGINEPTQQPKYTDGNMSAMGTRKDIKSGTENMRFSLVG